MECSLRQNVDSRGFEKSLRVILKTSEGIDANALRMPLLRWLRPGAGWHPLHVVSMPREFQLAREERSLPSLSSPNTPSLLPIICGRCRN